MEPKKRERLVIMQEILRLARDRDMGISHIVYQANLNFRMAYEYLKSMELSGLIRQENGKYGTTEKGCDFMGNVQVLQMQIRTKAPSPSWLKE